MATCSLDKTVRVWNYAEQEHSCEILKEYDEEALSIGFHPSGFHLVVAFSDKIRMMNIFEKDLVTYKEINVKACSEISFSNGGHLFAIANTNIIQVFNLKKLNLKARLKICNFKCIKKEYKFICMIFFL